MKKFIVITLAIVIVALVLNKKNLPVFLTIIKFASDQFGKTFNAVTNVGQFK
jgi:hypothetical protein